MLSWNKSRYCIFKISPFTNDNVYVKLFHKSFPMRDYCNNILFHHLLCLPYKEVTEYILYFTRVSPGFKFVTSIYNILYPMTKAQVSLSIVQSNFLCTDVSSEFIYVIQHNHCPCEKLHCSICISKLVILSEFTVPWLHVYDFNFN